MIVSDSSPIIFLSKINSLSLLERTYGKVIIPKEVEDEIFFKEQQENQSIRGLMLKKLIEIREVKKYLSLDIGKGETASISLALELNYPLLIDEVPGTKIAKSLGIKTGDTVKVIPFFRHQHFELRAIRHIYLHPFCRSHYCQNIVEFRSKARSCGCC